MRCVLLEGLSLREADGKIQEDPIRKINEVKHSCNVGRQKKLFLVLAVMSLNIKETKYVQCTLQRGGMYWVVHTIYHPR